MSSPILGVDIGGTFPGWPLYPERAQERMAVLAEKMARWVTIDSINVV